MIVHPGSRIPDFFSIADPGVKKQTLISLFCFRHRRQETALSEGSVNGVRDVLFCK
jgi:hypothetical protein